MAEHPMETTWRTALWRQVRHRRDGDSRILRTIWPLAVHPSIQWLTCNFRESEAFNWPTEKRWSSLEPIHLFTLLTYARAFTEWTGEPQSPGIYT